MYLDIRAASRREIANRGKAYERWYRSLRSYLRSRYFKLKHVGIMRTESKHARDNRALYKFHLKSPPLSRRPATKPSNAP
jgi:hypothetical protein